jgi:hypothetical protein
LKREIRAEEGGVLKLKYSRLLKFINPGEERKSLPKFTESAFKGELSESCTSIFYKINSCHPLSILKISPLEYGGHAELVGKTCKRNASGLRNWLALVCCGRAYFTFGHGRHQKL